MATRYAIIIGINDYTIDRLEYCVNDANSINEALLDRCKFKEENTHLIISDNQHPVKEVLGKFKEAIDHISQTFISEEDSFFFFFAGHGFFEQEKSKLCLHDSEYSIADIFDEVSFKLKPRVQLYVIDACQSGGKVITRNRQKVTNILDQYESSADGAMMLFACGIKEGAGEYKDLEHGLLTSYFIKAIYDDSLYDSDGILTPTVIQDYVTKATSKDTEFSQIPVIENRIAGVYPLAEINNQQLNNKNDEELKKQRIINSENEKETKKSDQTLNSQAIESKIRFDFDSRNEVQDFLYDKVSEKLNDFTSKNFEEILIDYTKLSINSEYLFKERCDNLNNFHKTIYSIAESRNIMPIDEIFIKKEVKSKSNNSISEIVSSMSKLNSFQNLFYPNSIEPKEYEYFIDYNNKYFEYTIDIFEANNIFKCSFGIGFFIYQAKWGVVIFFIYFKLDWDGEKDSYIKNIKIVPFSYIIDENLETKVSDIKLKNFWDITEKIKEWNSKREYEVNEFINGTD